MLLKADIESMNGRYELLEKQYYAGITAIESEKAGSQA